MVKRMLTVLAAAIGVLLIGLAISNNRLDSSAASASETPESAAQRDLPNLIRHMKVAAQDYGFKTEQEVESITLGRAYEVYYLNYQQVEQYRAGVQPDQLVSPAQRWQFPIMLKSQAKGLATLAYEGGKLQFVAFSANWRQAQSLVDLQTRHDRDGSTEVVNVLPVDALYVAFALTQQNNRLNVTLLSDVPPGAPRFYLANLEAGHAYELTSLVPQLAQELAKARQTLPRN